MAEAGAWVMFTWDTGRARGFSPTTQYVRHWQQNIREGDPQTPPSPAQISVFCNTMPSVANAIPPPPTASKCISNRQAFSTVLPPPPPTTTWRYSLCFT